LRAIIDKFLAHSASMSKDDATPEVDFKIFEDALRFLLERMPVFHDYRVIIPSGLT
jgi:hypothetical protein